MKNRRKKEKINYLDLQVRIDTGNWTETAVAKPDPNRSYGQYFLQIQTKINEIIERINEK